jgi:hypothetical protein
VKTRVRKWFDRRYICWMFGVDWWHEAIDVPAPYVSLSGKSYEPTHYPASWWSWPLTPKCFGNSWEGWMTPDENQARDFAQRLSKDPDSNALVVVAEFADGVEFKPLA